MSIALTAPTGKVGTAFLTAARERGIAVRAFARASSTFAIAPTERVDFDLSDPATYAPALAGTTSIFLVTPGSPEQADQEIAIADAAHKAGVHVIKLSVEAAQLDGTTLSDLHQRVEQHLASARIPATILRPTFFMQNALGLIDPIRAGIFPQAMGTASMGQVDTADIAAAALAVAENPAAHAGKTYEITGPAALSGADFAATLSDVAGHSVRFIDVPEDAFRASLLEAGVPPWYAGGLVELYRSVRAGHHAGVSPDVERLTGRAPRTFAQWAQTNAALFRLKQPA